MRILIIGSEGFIGQHLWRELQDAGHLVAGMDIAANPKQQDARNASHVLNAIKKHEAEVVVNFASRSYEDMMFESIRDNVGLAGVVADVCGELEVRLVYGSSTEAYGDNGIRACHETEGPFKTPTSLNGLMNLWGEQISQARAPKGYTALRLGHIYGPGLTIGKSELVDYLWNGKHREEMSVKVGQNFGGCWVGDAVHAVRLAIERGDGVFNIAYDEGATTFQVAELACVLTAADKGKIIASPAPAVNIPKVTLTKIQRLGWEAKMATYQGMQQTYDMWVNFLDESGTDERTRVSPELEAVTT